MTQRATPNYCRKCGHPWPPNGNKCNYCNFQLHSGMAIQNVVMVDMSTPPNVRPLLLRAEDAYARYNNTYNIIDKNFADQTERTKKRYEKDLANLPKIRNHKLIHYVLGLIGFGGVLSYILYPFLAHPWVAWGGGVIFVIVAAVLGLEAHTSLNMKNLESNLETNKDKELKRLEDEHLMNHNQATESFNKTMLDAIRTLAPEHLKSQLIQLLAKSRVTDPNAARLFYQALSELLKGDN